MRPFRDASLSPRRKISLRLVERAGSIPQTKGTAPFSTSLQPGCPGFFRSGEEHPRHCEIQRLHHVLEHWPEVDHISAKNMEPIKLNLVDRGDGAPLLH